MSARVRQGGRGLRWRELPRREFPFAVTASAPVFVASVTAGWVHLLPLAIGCAFAAAVLIGTETQRLIVGSSDWVQALAVTTVAAVAGMAVCQAVGRWPFLLITFEAVSLVCAVACMVGSAMGLRRLRVREQRKGAAAKTC